MDELRILNGLHRGATLPLHGAVVTLGSGEEAGMVLADHGIADRHARIQPDGAGGWRAVAEDGVLQDGHDTAPHAELALHHGQPVRLGDSGIWLALAAQGAPWEEPPQPPVPATERHDAGGGDADYPDFHADDIPAQAAPPLPPPRRRRRRLLLLTTLAAMASMGAVGAYAMVERPAPLHTARPPAIAGAARPAPPAAPAEAPAAAGATLEAQFRQRLAEAELLRRFELDLQPGLWNMHGDLDSEEQARFERILAAFVQQHGIAFPVNARVVTAEGMLPFAIEQVVSGANPSIVTRDGRRLYVGDDYRGVRLLAIDGQRVSFLGKRKIEVNW